MIFVFSSLSFILCRRALKETCFLLSSSSFTAASAAAAKLLFHNIDCGGGGGGKGENLLSIYRSSLGLLPPPPLENRLKMAKFAANRFLMQPLLHRLYFRRLPLQQPQRRHQSTAAPAAVEHSVTQWKWLRTISV
jgi:hypothetical protein